MTGHNNSIQNQTPTFMTTLQSTLDILDDISGRIDENTYLTLANNLQQLHNIHTSNPTSYPPIITPINYTRNDYVSTISYASIRNFDISNANTTNIINDIINNDIINNNTNNNNNNNEYRNIQALNEETNRMNYSTRTRLILYGNAFNNGAS